MKKIFNTSIAYFASAMAAGVFYREFTRFDGFTGVTTLGVVHTHLLVLGMVISTGMSAMISGIAGISHIMMLIAFILLFISLKKTFIKE